MPFDSPFDNKWNNSPFGGGGGFSPLSLAPDGWWDTSQEAAIMSGADVVTVPDLSGNGRSLTAGGTSGGTTISSLNGRDAIHMTGGANDTGLYSDAVGALIAAGTSTPFMVAGVFQLDAAPANTAAWGFDDNTATNEWNFMWLRNAGASNLMQAIEKNAASALDSVYLSVTGAALTTYSFVWRQNSDQTLDVWVNDVLVDSAVAMGSVLMSAMTRFSVGSLNQGGGGNIYDTAGTFAEFIVKAGEPSTLGCKNLASYLFNRWNA